MKEGMVFIEKKELQESLTPSLDEVKNEVKDKVREKKSREKALQSCEVMLEKIKEGNIADLKSFAQKEKLEIKETDYFSANDYIEGLGLNQNASNIIFSLEKNQIHPEPVLLLKGAYIIQLIDMTPVDQEELELKRGLYKSFLFRLKLFSEESKFLKKLEDEANLEIYLPRKESAATQ